MSNVVTRLAKEEDTDGIIEVYKETYGEDYCYDNFYNASYVKRIIYAQDTITVVAVDNDSEKVLGTASVLEERGSLNDLIGEFGRLAVHPHARNLGIGSKLMEARLQHINERLHVGIIDSRVANPYTAKISKKNNFATVGFIPAKIRIDRRENVASMIRHFGDALTLRRNNPRIICEAQQLAHLALENCKIKPDVIADDSTPSYPDTRQPKYEELKSEGYSDLLRIERGRVKKREVFGPVKLHYGFFKLQAKKSHYLNALENNAIVASVGYLVNEKDHSLVIFEMIALNDSYIPGLIKKLIKDSEEKYKVVYFEVNVSAHATAMQRTLLEHGFLPVSYMPAYVFDAVERLDILKMVKLNCKIDISYDFLHESAKPFAELVLRQFEEQQIAPALENLVTNDSFLSLLSKPQRLAVARHCKAKSYKAGELIFEYGSLADEVHILLKGEVQVLNENNEELAELNQGACYGERSFLKESPHLATIRAVSDSEVASISFDELKALERLRPDIGLLLYKALAKELSGKM